MYMTPDGSEIKKIIEENRCNYSSVLKKKYPEFYRELKCKNCESFAESLYLHLNKNKPKCLQCGSFTKFIDINDGYREFCSNACVNKSQHTKNRIKSSFIEKYGIDNISKLDSVKSKKKSTLLKNYKTNDSFSVNNGRENARISLIKKYGTENILSVSSIREKSTETKRKKFYKKCVSGERLKNTTPEFSCDEYDSIRNKNLKFKCKTCDHIFQSYLKYGNDPICPKCNISTFQKEVVDFLKTYIHDIDINNKNILENRELDIYIPSKRIAIECNGLYWHSEVSGKKTSYYHIQKTNMCEKNDIQLIHIFEDEWLFKKNIVKEKLKSILKLNHDGYIHARKTVIREINSKDSNEFLEKYHIQGGETSSCFKFGLYYKEELVATMTFGKLRKSLGNVNIDHHYELIRYASKYRTIGGAGKLINHFKKHHVIEKIITYADLRFTDKNNNLYTKIGFKKVKITKCNYFYISGNKRYHRYNFRKNILSKKLKKYDEKLTEWENMKLNGYDRIWDCGHIKYEL